MPGRLERLDLAHGHSEPFCDRSERLVVRLLDFVAFDASNGLAQSGDPPSSILTSTPQSSRSHSSISDSRASTPSTMATSSAVA